VSVCLYLCVCVCLSVDTAKSSNRRAVTSWSVARNVSSRLQRRRRRLYGAGAVAATDDDELIDDDVVEFEDDSLPLHVNVDVKPSDWFLAQVCY